MSPGNLSLRPYLLRAVHEWISDRGETPQVVVQADREDVEAPRERISRGRLVLNISYQATRNLDIGQDALRFEARFGGVARRVSVPIDAVLCIFCRETGQGVALTDQFDEALEPPDQSAPDQSAPRPRGTPNLRLVK